MGETKLFEALNQLKQLFLKMIRCFEAFEPPQSDGICWSKHVQHKPHPNMIAPFRNRLQMFSTKRNLLKIIYN